MSQEEIKKKISKMLFWDIDFSKIDFDSQKQYIIPRVMDRGTKKDVKLIWDYYGEDVIKEALLKARFLEDKTIYFFANIFSIEPNEFRAFQLKQTQINWSL